MNYIAMVLLLTGKPMKLENTMAINPLSSKLYAIGTDTETGMSNLYIKFP